MKYNYTRSGAGETAQQVRALAALLEEPDSFSTST